jgi:hypothetical protein
LFFLSLFSKKLPIMVQLNRLLCAVSLALAPVVAQEAAPEVPEVTDFSPSEVVDGNALAALSQMALNNSEVATVTERMTRRGPIGCALNQIKIRKEW